MNGKNYSSTSPFGRRHFPRDSGCYEGSPVPSQNQQCLNSSSDIDANNLDSVVTQCSNEIIKHMENARRNYDDKFPVPKTLNRAAKKGGLLGGNDDLNIRCGAFSEKSSDSGVSSSSLSSGPIKNST